MSLRITAMVERWLVAGQFVIARGAKSHVDVLVVAVSDGIHIGYGEGTAIYYRGESAEICLARVVGVTDQLEPLGAKPARLLLQDLLPPGAARNALDCALWDLEAKAARVPLWKYIGLGEAPKPVVTAFTISSGNAAAMKADAADAARNGYGLLKLKLTGEGDRSRVAAVRAGAPNARLIVDANESWQDMDIAAEASALADFGVEMIEQPLPVGIDTRLAARRFALPMLADESCHEAADVALLARHYDGINIKLDKAGGLTEAIKIADAAEEFGLKIMVGCMLSTSLGIAPAMLLAGRANWVDLDGPALLANDRNGGFSFEGGMVVPPLHAITM